jgi:type II pantothenate kinase
MKNTHDASIFLNSVKETSEIILPWLDFPISVLALDIGGSLAKVVYFEKVEKGGILHFSKYETIKIQECLEYIKNLQKSLQEKLIIMATGGGSHKYFDLVNEELGIELLRIDEMETLVKGLDFLSTLEYEVFTYDQRRSSPLIFCNPNPSYPYILVNIGSGVSILKVSQPGSYERISGTSLGGGTLWGLLSLLTDAKDYDAMLELSLKGDNKNVDMLVGDIYGGDYNKIGLKGSTIASTFGKVFKLPRENRKELNQEDIASSLLYLVSNNIGQIAYLNAQAHGISRIYFSGFFIRNHAITMNTISYAVNYWSKGTMEALFLKHEGYLGAIGAFLHQPCATLN